MHRRSVVDLRAMAVDEGVPQLTALDCLELEPLEGTGDVPQSVRVHPAAELTP